MKRYFLALTFLALILNVHAQWECPSHLAAHLDPIANSPVLLGAETQISTGILDGNSINTAMGFIGIDYSTQKHSLYFEGGIKAWWKYDFEEELLFDQYRFGMRELFYQYRGEINSITLGLQSSALDDHYLLNERVAGLNWKIDYGKWKFNAYAGSVTKDFARNGIFCTTGFIYDLQTGQDQAVLGNNLGDKNLAAFTLSFFPGKSLKSKKSDTPSADDEFESFDSDEFEASNNEKFESPESDDFLVLKTGSSATKSSTMGFALENIGIVAYSEFGDWISNTFFHTGLFVSLKLPGEIYFNPEVLYQYEESNKGLIYLAEMEKRFRLKSGNRLALNAAYYAFTEIDKNATVLNSYSNILAGEVLRLDAVNLPIYLLGLKYSIPSAKMSFKFQNAGQLNNGNLNEWDIEIGKQLRDKLHLKFKGGIISGGELEEKAYLGRLEARFYF